MPYKHYVNISIVKNNSINKFSEESIMNLDKDFELTASEISSEIELLFNSVMSTVVDYFEEVSSE